MTEPAFEICERVAEVQALLHDHVECGKHTAAEVVAKAAYWKKTPNCVSLRQITLQDRGG